MFDRKTRLMLILGLLNDAFGDVRSIMANISDFIGSHPEMREEIEEFKLNDILNHALNLEREIDEVMSKLKREIFEER
jgi:peptidoglycan/xylan/chitin deacetylase (PgdA/CDA1 family)